MRVVASLGLLALGLLCVPLPCRASADDATPEVGVAYITHFKGINADIPTAKSSAETFYSGMLGYWPNLKWTGRFELAEQYAWEAFFKSGNAKGIEDLVLDSADLALIATHGVYNSPAADPHYMLKYPTALDFRPNASYLTSDDGLLVPGEVDRSWGDRDLEWLFLDASDVLSNINEQVNGPAMHAYWARSMHGLHLLAGFGTTTYATGTGDGLVFYRLTGQPSRTVLQSWFETIDGTQPYGVLARVLGEAYDSFNDHIWGQGYVSPDYPVDSQYWMASHYSTNPKGAPPHGSYIDEKGYYHPGTALLYEVVPRTVDASYVQTLAGRFGLRGVVGAAGPPSDELFLDGDNGRTITVDQATGIFSFMDLTTLWKPPVNPPSLPSQDEAAETVTGFLGAHDLYPPDAVLDEVITESLKEMSRETGKELSRVDIDQQVIFSRRLEVTSDGRSGPVVGPGAKLMGYVGESGIIGLRGGWRQVRPAGSIPILSSDEALAAFRELGNKVLLAPPAKSFDDVDVQSVTLGYYEQGAGVVQAQLAPVWIFEVEFLLENHSQGTGALFVPASAEFFPVVAEIVTPEDGVTAPAADPIRLEGTASYGTPPYTFEWTSDADGPIGTGARLEISGLSVAEQRGQLVGHTVTLKVVDSKGDAAYDSVSVNVTP